MNAWLLFVFGIGLGVLTSFVVGRVRRRPAEEPVGQMVHLPQPVTLSQVRQEVGKGRSDDLRDVNKKLDELLRATQTATRMPPPGPDVGELIALHETVRKVDGGFNNVYRQLIELGRRLDTLDQEIALAIAPATATAALETVPVASQLPAEILTSLVQQWNQPNWHERPTALLHLNEGLRRYRFCLSEALRNRYHLLYPEDPTAGGYAYLFPVLGKDARHYEAEFFALPAEGTTTQRLESPATVRFRDPTLPIGEQLEQLDHDRVQLKALTLVERGRVA